MLVEIGHSGVQPQDFLSAFTPFESFNRKRESVPWKFLVGQHNFTLRQQLARTGCKLILSCEPVGISNFTDQHAGDYRPNTHPPALKVKGRCSSPMPGAAERRSAIVRPERE